MEAAAWSGALLRSSINSIIAIPGENSHHCRGFIMQSLQLGASKHPVDAEGVGFTPRTGVSRRPTHASPPRSQALAVIERVASVISHHRLPLDCSSALGLLINLRRGRFLTRMIKTNPPPLLSYWFAVATLPSCDSITNMPRCKASSTDITLLEERHFPVTSDPLHNMGHDVEVRLIANIDHGGIIQYSMSTAA